MALQATFDVIPSWPFINSSRLRAVSLFSSGAGARERRAAKLRARREKRGRQPEKKILCCSSDPGWQVLHGWMPYIRQVHNALLYEEKVCCVYGMQPWSTHPRVALRRPWKPGYRRAFAWCPQWIGRVIFLHFCPFSLLSFSSLSQN